MWFPRWRQGNRRTAFAGERNCLQQKARTDGVQAEAQSLGTNSLGERSVEAAPFWKMSVIDDNEGSDSWMADRGCVRFPYEDKSPRGAEPRTRRRRSLGATC